jgi:hypothetical protein
LHRRKVNRPAFRKYRARYQRELKHRGTEFLPLNLK